MFHWQRQGRSQVFVRRATRVRAVSEVWSSKLNCILTNRCAVQCYGVFVYIFRHHCEIVSCIGDSSAIVDVAGEKRYVFGVLVLRRYKHHRWIWTSCRVHGHDCVTRIVLEYLHPHTCTHPALAYNRVVQKRHKVYGTIIMQPFITDLCGFQQNVPKKILYMIKVSV